MENGFFFFGAFPDTNHHTTKNLVTSICIFGCCCTLSVRIRERREGRLESGSSSSEGDAVLRHRDLRTWQYECLVSSIEPDDGQSRGSLLSIPASQSWYLVQSDLTVTHEEPIQSKVAFGIAKPGIGWHRRASCLLHSLDSPASPKSSASASSIN